MQNVFKNERGISLIATLGMMLVMLIIVAASLLFTSISTRATANIRNGTITLHIADAGISHAIKELSNNDGVKDFATIYAASSGTQIVSNNTFNGSSYIVTQQSVTNGRMRIRSVATGPNGTSGQVEAWVESPWVCGICSLGNVSMGGNGSIDSYDSSKGAYNAPLAGGGSNKGSAGHVSSNGNITLGGGSAIYGNASAVGTISGTVTGMVVAGASPVTYPPVSPCGPPYSSGTGIVGGSYNSSTGKLTTSSHAVVTLAPGSYCFSSVNMGSHSSLLVSGVTTINLTGDSDFSAANIINAGRPSTLTIKSSATDELKVKSGTDASMILNCPLCTLTVSSNGDFFGSIVAGTVVANGGAQIHYDTSLAPPPVVKMYSWVQTF